MKNCRSVSTDCQEYNTKQRGRLLAFLFPYCTATALHCFLLKSSKKLILKTLFVIGIQPFLIKIQQNFFKKLLQPLQLLAQKLFSNLAKSSFWQKSRRKTPNRGQNKKERKPVSPFFVLFFFWKYEFLQCRIKQLRFDWFRQMGVHTCCPGFLYIFIKGVGAHSDNRHCLFSFSLTV